MDSKRVAFAATCVAFAIAAYLQATHSRARPCYVLQRFHQRLGIYTAALLLWPALLVGILGWEPFISPISATMVAIVLLYLSFEVSGLSAYSGALSDYESSDAIYERGVQVSTVAFAVATLLLSQKDGEMAATVAGPVFLSLLCCTAAAVPSSLARKRLHAAAHWNALQKIAVSFAAGLLCISVARCLDKLNWAHMPVPSG